MQRWLSLGLQPGLRHQFNFAFQLSIFWLLSIPVLLTIFYCQDAPHPLIALTSEQITNVHTFREHSCSLRNYSVPSGITLEEIIWQRKSMFFKSVKNGKLPICECNQWVKGILTSQKVNKTFVEGTWNKESCDSKSNSFVKTCRHKLS